MEIIPGPAMLEYNDESFILSVEDTIWLYSHLTGLAWQEGMYAEYCPTHTLTLWNGEYRFYLADSAPYHGINYVCGGACMGSHQIKRELMELICKRLIACHA